MTEKEKAQLDRIESAIIGNGREGLISRTARIEERLEATLEASDKVAEVTEKIMAILVPLEASVRSHHATEHLSNLVKKKQFWTIIVVGYIVLHVIATYVPDAWDWLVVLVGVPILSIPIK